MKKSLRVKVCEWDYEDGKVKWHRGKEIWAHFVNDPMFSKKTPHMLSIELGPILKDGKRLTVCIPTQDIVDNLPE